MTRYSKTLLLKKNNSKIGSHKSLRNPEYSNLKKLFKVVENWTVERRLSKKKVIFNSLCTVARYARYSPVIRVDVVSRKLNLKSLGSRRSQKAQHTRDETWKKINNNNSNNNKQLVWKIDNRGTRTVRDRGFATTKRTAWEETLNELSSLRQWHDGFRLEGWLVGFCGGATPPSLARSREIPQTRRRESRLMRRRKLYLGLVHFELLALATRGRIFCFFAFSFFGFVRK